MIELYLHGNVIVEERMTLEDRLANAARSLLMLHEKPEWVGGASEVLPYFWENVGPCNPNIERFKHMVCETFKES